MSGYVRPRLTEKQAAVLRLVIERELASGYRRHESVILARAGEAIDAAVVAREERRQRRLGAELAAWADRRAAYLGLRRGRPPGMSRWLRRRAS